MRTRKEKIKDINTASAYREKLASQGKKLVFTNGCFDLLHLGHVTYLEQARKQGHALMVALNSDRSVRELKGHTRPLVSEQERMQVIASLECVDAVLIFDTLRVDNVIKQVKPHIYAKGGDYTIDTLNPDEREAILANEGDIKLIPFVEGFSSTNIIEKIEQTALARDATLRRGDIKTVFLDRDGVLNKENGHVTSPEEMTILPGVPEAINKLNSHDIECFIISNQSGLARGLYNEKTLEDINNKLLKEITAKGGNIKGIYISPWHPDPALKEGVEKYLKDSPERKPKPGLIFKAQKEHKIDLAHSIFVGDSTKDMKAAQAAGLPFYAIRSNKYKELPTETKIYNSLHELVETLLNN